MYGYHFDDESLLEISREIDSIKNNPDIPMDQKAKLMDDYFEGIEPERKREYFEYRNYVAFTEANRDDKFVGVPAQQGKVAMVEFDNLQFGYSLAFGMIGAIMYLQTRLGDYKCSEDAQKSIRDFLKYTFGNYSDKYIGTIYDLYYKENKEKHATYIPEIDPNVLGNAMPTPEQVKNFTDFCTNKLEEIRATTTALTGYLPSQEALIRIHGIFDELNGDFVKYRDETFLEFDRTAMIYPIPVGHYRLMDPFRQMRMGINVFNPTEPDVEILNGNKLKLNASQSKNFEKRLSNLGDRLTKEQASLLKSYNDQLNEMHKIPNKDPKTMKKMEFIKKNIKDIQEAVAADDEVITKVVKFDRNKKTVSIEDKLAKKDGELDIF